MLTIIALPKAFHGHFGIIQRNAITSWTRLHPKPEIILFGDEVGTAEIARELDLRHVPTIETNEYGTPLLSDLFKKAHTMAQFSTLCYVNADMLLLGEFMEGVQQVVSWRDSFLMVGRRTNLDLNQALDFSLPDWDTRVRSSALRHGILGASYYIDYFVFPRELAMVMLPFAIGRPGWDNWFIWKVRRLRIPVVEASSIVMAIHQNHDYSHIPKGLEGPQHVEEARRNRALAAPGLSYALDDATYRLTAQGIKWDPFYWLGRTRINSPWWWAPFTFTRSLRGRFGITKANLRSLLIKTKLVRSGVGSTR